MISIGGGYAPAWSKDGRSLFYRAPTIGADVGRQMLAVDIQVGETLVAGRPRLLFDKTGYALSGWMRSYDVTPEGKFVMVARTGISAQPVTELNVVLNWFEELKQRVPTGR